jgi:hypothetical protein
MSCSRYRDTIAAATMADVCTITALAPTPQMTERFTTATLKVWPLARIYGAHLATCPEITTTDLLEQPTTVAEEALWRHLTGEAALLAERLNIWLNVSQVPTWADKTLQFALEELLFGSIAGEMLFRRRLGDA